MVTFPFIFVYFVARLLRRRDYRKHFRERLGLLPRLFTATKGRAIWLHAVSVGEVVSAIPLLESLRQSVAGCPIYLSTSTVAGRKIAEQRAAPLVTGIFYLPLDYVWCVRRVLSRLQPALLVVVETEIWPNLFAEAKRAGASLAIVNGRISGRAWPRYQAWKWVFEPVLQLPDLVVVQSSADRERYAALGVPAERLLVEANLKYDAALSRGVIEISNFGAEQVWIAASTVGANERGSVKRHSVDEDDLVIAAFRELAAEFPHLLLILAPRQRARFNRVAHKLERAGVSYVRRSEHGQKALALPGVLLLDTIGELARAYSLAQVVFVGGSLAPRGGHNIIEPAAAGVPVVIGPHMQNFEAIVEDFSRADAVLQIGAARELAPAIRGFLRDPTRASELGERGRTLVERQQGAAERLAERLQTLYLQGSPRRSHSFPAQLALRALAAVWEHGGASKRQRGLKRAATVPALPVPVVSVGGVTVGGSGKTPFTAYLANGLQGRGYVPAILTRGYRRRSPAKSLVLAPGVGVPAAFTGDEAQIFLRENVAPVGIGADRYETGKLLLAKFPRTDVLLLDDGFQHARMRRDVDIVMIDGLDPLGQGAVVPLGRLREPLTSLERADLLVVTRAESPERFKAVEASLRAFNQEAPIFRTRLLTRCWRDGASGKNLGTLSGRPVAAFCGLGNPRSFWDTIEAQQLQIVFRWSFPDHHAYQPNELRRLAHQAEAHGAELLITTEKDRMNCPAHVDRLVAPMQLAWLEIDFELEGEAQFFEILGQRLGTAKRTRSSEPPFDPETGGTGEGSSSAIVAVSSQHAIFQPRDRV